MSDYWNDRWKQRNNGVLEAMVQQPVDNAIEVSWDNGARYTERWKGPYSQMKGVTTNGGEVMGRNFLVGQELPAIPSNDKWQSLIGAPSPLTGMKWMVDAITATELEAGDHGILEITYKAVPDNLLPMGGYGTSAETGDPSGRIKVVTANSGWTLRWGTYSRNVLEYCNISADSTDNDDNDEAAHADHIIKCAQLPKPRKSQIPEEWKEDTRLNFPQYMWVEPNQAGESVSADVRRLCISERERQIYNYYVRGVQPVFHYPILQYSETFEYPLSAVSGMIANHNLPVEAEYVDIKADWDTHPALKQCPFDLKSNLKGNKWEFLDVGTECTTRESTSIEKATFQVTWTHTWEGAVVIDENFYSEDATKRWFPGGGTWADQDEEGEEEEEGGQQGVVEGGGGEG